MPDSISVHSLDRHYNILDLAFVHPNPKEVGTAFTLVSVYSSPSEEHGGTATIQGLRLPIPRLLPKWTTTTDILPKVTFYSLSQ